MTERPGAMSRLKDFLTGAKSAFLKHRILLPARHMLRLIGIALMILGHTSIARAILERLGPESITAFPAEPTSAPSAKIALRKACSLPARNWAFISPSMM